MEYLKVHDWERWQTYRKDRGQPPWIKVYRRLLRNPEWVSLTDAERGQLVAIWLLAADHDGDIPASPELVQKLTFMTKPPNIKKFIELGFVNHNGCQGDANVTPSGCQDDRPKAKAETKAEAEKDTRHDSAKSSYGSFQNVKLTDEEYQKIVERFGTSKGMELIDELSEGLASKKYKYHNHYATVLSWARRKGINGKQKDDPYYDRRFWSVDDSTSESGAD